MRKKILAWLEFFRLPNLPSAPGDAIAGGAIAILSGASPDARAILFSSLCVLALYMAGLADNDITGAKEDETAAPFRPIPSGRISPKCASAARLALFAMAFSASAIASLGANAILCMAFLSVFILLYNRLKKFRVPGFILMGLCRGTSLLAGATACGIAPFANLPLTAAFSCWVLYVALLTAYASDEHSAGKPLSAVRFLPAAVLVLAPLSLCLPGCAPHHALPALLGGILAASQWYAAFMPLGLEHDPETRRAAIGKSIGALLYLQAGFALSAPCRALPLAMALCFAARFAIRKWNPSITGS